MKLFRFHRTTTSTKTVSFIKNRVGEARFPLNVPFTRLQSCLSPFVIGLPTAPTLLPKPAINCLLPVTLLAVTAESKMRKQGQHALQKFWQSCTFLTMPVVLRVLVSVVDWGPIL
jgi:hypothetical protein